ncbi:replication protein P [Escherichia coli]|uniref:replication protein P n=1 Tax=Escherichia coli TaxID=562 RepID=UPI000DA4445F|nr:replication protein P [Escherichia coli]SQZ64778.1 putative replication protein P of bacteriophage [Escherichia coli]
MKSTPELLNEYDRFRGGHDHSTVVASADDERAKKEQVARIFNEMFVQLQAAFPGSIAAISEQGKLNEFRKQWMLAFLENGITTMEQVNAGMRHARASESPFWPSPGQFIKWCKDSKMVLGVTIDDVMAEFHRYSKEKSLYPGGPERFPWRHPVMYWVVCDTRRAMYQRQLSEIEVEKHARRLLDDWAKKVASGQQIPDPVISIQAKPEPMSTSPDTGRDVYHPPGRSFGCMPNAATLGGITPAQWLMEEYRRGKAAGFIK